MLGFYRDSCKMIVLSPRIAQLPITLVFGGCSVIRVENGAGRSFVVVVLLFSVSFVQPVHRYDIAVCSTAVVTILLRRCVGH